MMMDGRFRRGSHIVIALCHGLRFGFIRRQHPDRGEDRALAPDAQGPNRARKLLHASRPQGPDCRLRRAPQPPALHESLGNLTPADVYFGRGQTIMLQRERIKRETINQRRLLYRKAAA